MKSLFCFPFAGGSSYAYQPLRQTLSDIEIPLVELPGRGRRFGEPLLRDMTAMADDLFQQIKPQATGPFAFFGHSMGAGLAYLVALRLSDAGMRLPDVLFVSGRGAPATDVRRNWHLLPGDAFDDMLRGLGGVPPEALADPELYAVFEPILRADFEAHSGFPRGRIECLDVPIVAFFGSDDATVESDPQQWQEVSSHPLETHVLPGGHFFVLDHWPTISRLITERWRKVA